MGADTIENLVEKKNKLIQKFLSTGIPLSKWRSNTLFDNAAGDIKIIFLHENEAAKFWESLGIPNWTTSLTN